LAVFTEFIGQIGVSGEATLWSFPVVLAIVVVIVGQLLPPDPLQRLQTRLERLQPAVLAVALAAVIMVVGATVPSQGVPPFIYFQF
jgi:hypothetical protein